MRRVSLLVLFVTAATCWLAAGPGGVTLQALLACRHHAMHASHPSHGDAPSDGPCFCGEMTSGSDLALSVAVPAPPITAPVVVTPDGIAIPPSLFPLPPSPVSPPVTPPPIGPG